MSTDIYAGDGPTPPALPRGMIKRFAGEEVRPGVYLLDEPVALASVCNFWEQEDADAGGCKQEEVGDPIHYFLYAVRILPDRTWCGYDEPPKPGASDSRRRRRVLRDECAVFFDPKELDPDELLKFRRGARRVTR